VYEEILQARPEDVSPFWGNDPIFRDFALWTCGLIGHEMGWRAPRFYPWDPVEVVLWDYEDGLDSESVILKLELTDSDMERIVRGGELGVLVERAYANAPAYEPYERVFRSFRLS